MPEIIDYTGKAILSLRPSMEYARENLKTAENLQRVEGAIMKLKSYFTDN